MKEEKALRPVQGIRRFFAGGHRRTDWRRSAPRPDTAIEDGCRDDRPLRPALGCRAGPIPSMCSPQPSTTTSSHPRKAPGRPDRRGRRCARGAHVACSSARRRRGQPVSGPWKSVRDLPPRRNVPRLEPAWRSGNLIKEGQGRAEGDAHKWASPRRLTAAPWSSRPSALDGAWSTPTYTDTATKIGGVGLDVLAQEVAAGTPRPSGLRHPPPPPPLEIGGEYQWPASRGRAAPVRPRTVFRLQHSTRSRRYDIFQAVHQPPSTSRPSA